MIKLRARDYISDDQITDSPDEGSKEFSSTIRSSVSSRHGSGWDGAQARRACAFRMVIMTAAAIGAPLASPASTSAQVVEWTAITSGRMIDIYDIDRSDEHLIANALSLLEVARASSSESATERLAAVESAHYRVVTFIDRPVTDTQVLIVRDARTAVVAVRGTTGGLDWATDLATMTTPDVGPYPAVHAGFAAAALSVRDAVSVHIAALLVSGVEEVWFTGHSLGGAVAQLLALSFEQWGHPVGGVVTFGAPPVGKSLWGATYGVLASRTQRWETHEDFVPCMAPDQAQWHQSGALHVLHGGGAALNQSESRCTQIPNPNPEALLCEDNVVRWLATVFGGLWHLTATCSIPDVFQGAVELVADLIAGRTPDAHKAEVYWDRLAGLIPHRVRVLTGASPP